MHHRVATCSFGRYIPPEVPQIVESVGSLPLSQLRPDMLELDCEEDITSEIKRLETEQQVVLSTLKQRFDAVSGRSCEFTQGGGD